MAHLLLNAIQAQRTWTGGIKVARPRQATAFYRIDRSGHGCAYDGTVMARRAAASKMSVFTAGTNVLRSTALSYIAPSTSDID